MTLEARGLSRRLPDGRLGLDQVSLKVSSQEFTLLTGHNGSGKSFLVRHLLGLEKPDAGAILLDEKPQVKDFRQVRENCALVFQEPEHQILGMTVREDLEFSPRSRGVGSKELEVLTADLLAKVGLSGMEDHLTAFLSGGEKRRLAIAAALASNPKLLILDEPFNGLDWPGVKILLKILLGLKAAGTGILIITHDLEKCLAHADRIAVMEAGSLILCGPPRDLWDQLGPAGLRHPGGTKEKLGAMTWLT